MNRKDRRAKGVKSQNELNALKAVQAARDLIKAGRVYEADKFYKLALQQDPNNPIALLDFALNTYQRGDVQVAKILFTQLVRTDPRNTAGLLGLALIHMDMGEREEAMALVERIETLRPSPQIVTKLGFIHRQDGNQEKAIECFERAIRMQPDYVTPYFNLIQLNVFGTDSDHFKNLQKIETVKNSLPHKSQVMLQFALGRAYQEAKDDARAFAHYAAGNLLVKQEHRQYSAEKIAAYTDSVINLFTEETVAKFKGVSGSDSSRPIFIVGMPRSGSTLLDQILSSHPTVTSIGEGRQIPQSIPCFYNKEVPDFFRQTEPSITAELMEKLSPEMLSAIAQKYLQLTDKKAGDFPHVIDKMLFNFMWIGFIKLAFPNAKIIHSARDPIDTGLSIWTLYFTDGMHWAYDQKDIAMFYNCYKKLMAHWEKLFPDAIHTVHYEQMVAHQEAESRKLLAFCGLPWDDQCLRFFETQRQVKTASIDQVRKPIYAASVKKWKKYEPYLQDMIHAIYGDKTPD